MPRGTRSVDRWKGRPKHNNTNRLPWIDAQSAYMRAGGWRRRAAEQRRLANIRREKLKPMLAMGMRTKDIAQALGCSIMTIHWDKLILEGESLERIATVERILVVLHQLRKLRGL